MIFAFAKCLHDAGARAWIDAKLVMTGQRNECEASVLVAIERKPRRREPFLSPPSQGGEKKAAGAQQNAPLAVDFSSHSTPTLHYAEARLRPSRPRPMRLSRSFALPD